MPGWRKVFLRPSTLRESGKDGRRDAREGIVRPWYFVCSFVFGFFKISWHCLISQYLDASITRRCAPILDDSPSNFSSFIVHRSSFILHLYTYDMHRSVDGQSQGTIQGEGNKWLCTWVGTSSLWLHFASCIRYLSGTYQAFYSTGDEPLPLPESLILQESYLRCSPDRVRCSCRTLSLVFPSSKFQPCRIEILSWMAEWKNCDFCGRGQSLELGTRRSTWSKYVPKNCGAYSTLVQGMNFAVELRIPHDVHRNR